MQTETRSNRFFSVVLGTITCLAIVCVSPRPGRAASDGSLSTNSAGSSTWSLGVPGRVKIGGLSDVSLNFSGSGNPSSNKRVCVYSNTGSGDYTIAATGNLIADGSAGAGFFVKMTAGRTIPYTVKWRDSAADGGTALTAGVALTAQSGASTTSASCNLSTNANFEILFNADNILDSPAGSYSGTVQIVISPAA